jgi:hypothetical protein
MTDNPLMVSTVDDAGNRVDQYADGTEHVSQPDGASITRHPNGTTTHIPPPPAPGEMPYEMRDWVADGPPVRDDNSIHIWHADREEITNVDGSIDIRYRDGRTVHHPATPMQGPIQPGMPRSHTVTGTDGSVLRIEPDGTRTYTHPQSFNPGTPPIVDNVPTIQRFRGDRPQVPPIVRVDPDGTQRAHDLDGTQHITDTDGVETTVPPKPLTDSQVRDIRQDLDGNNRFPVAPAGHMGDPEMFVHRDTGEVVIVKGDGTQVRHPGPPPYVFGPPDGDIAHKTTGQVHFEPDGSLVRPIELVSPNGSHGFGTLTTRPDGSTVFERPDHTIVFTAPDGSQPLLPRGAPPPPVIPSGPPPAPKPRGCSPPIIAAIGTILTLIGAGVVAGIALSDDPDEDTSLDVAERCADQLGLVVDPGEPVLIAQSCPSEDEDDEEATTTTESNGDDTGGGEGDTQVLVGEAAGLAETGTREPDPEVDVRASEVRIERSAAGDVFELHVQLFSDLDLAGGCFIVCTPPDPDSGDELCAFIDVGPTPITAPATVDVVIGAVSGDCDGSSPPASQTAQGQVTYTIGEDGTATGTLALGGADVPFTARP